MPDEDFPGDADAPAASPPPRPFRIGVLVGGVLFGAAAASLAFAGNLHVPAAFVIVPLGFFGGVPLGYLVRDRAAALRLTLLATGGIALGGFLAGLATALNVEGAPTLGRGAAGAAIYALVLGIIAYAFLTLGVLLGRRAGTPRFRRETAFPEE